jgi:alpha-2-macroglobulin
MNRIRFWLLAVLLLGWAFVSAQDTELPLGSHGTFSPDQNITLSVYHNSKTSAQINFTILRFNNPLEVLQFGWLVSWQSPTIPSRAVRSVVSRVTQTLGEGDSEVSLGRLSAGLYEIQAQFGVKRGSSLVLVSDLGMITKQSPQDVRILTLNRISGQKRSAKIWLVQSKNLRELMTDTNGLLLLPLLEKDVIVVAQAGQNFAVVNSSWAYGLAQKYVFTGQTDRTMYRPSDSIEFRGNFRFDKTLVPLAKRQISAVLCFGEQELSRVMLETNAFGTFAGRFELRRSARVSAYNYSIYLNPEGLAGCTYDGLTESRNLADFAVQEYIKPNFNVSLKTPLMVLQGTRSPLEISAAYLFGGAMSNGRVKVTFSRASSFTRDDPNYRDFGFEYSDEYGAYDNKIVLEQVTALDATGKLKLELPFEVNKFAFPMRYNVFVQVEDESHNLLERYVDVFAYPSSLRVSLRTTRALFNAGEPFEIDVRSRNLQGTIANSNVELQLFRQEYIQGFSIKDGQRQVTWTLKETPLEKRTVQTRSGAAKVVFKPSFGGGYVVRARTKDTAGRLSKAETFGWQLSSNENWGWNVDYAQVRLNKTSYKVGETVTALIMGLPVGVDIWVSLEVDSVLQTRLVRTTRPTFVYSFKVTSAMQPNVYLQISYLHKGIPYGTQYGGGANVSVPKDDQRLNLQILPSKTQYAPSETGQLEVRVTNAAQQPVQTELSLAVVDEGVYLLREDGTPNPFDIFHGDRPNLVGTASSEDMDGELGGGGDGEGDVSNATRDDQDAGRVRKDFRDTALWVANVITDANGLAKIPVSYPDNLTTWRITARGQTLAGAAGESKTSTLVTKDILARIAKPEFLIRGDSTTLRGIVNNNLLQNSSGVFKFDLLGLSSNTPLEGRLDVPAKARANFDTKITATQLGEAKIQARYTSPLGSDALELPIPVKPRGFTDTQTWAGDATNNQKTFVLPEDTRLETTKLHLSLTPSLLSAVRPALDRLIAYPYGCTEQTLSRFVPAMLAAEIAPRDDLPDLLNAGLARLETLRHTDGGWGFWSYDQSAMDMTASVVLALARLQKQKIPRDNYKTILEGGIKWLQNNIKNTSFSRGSRALAHRALAEAQAPDLDTMQLFAAVPDLEPYHLAQLALAYNSLNRLEQAKNLLERLKITRIERDSTVQWQRPKNPYRWNYYWDDNPILVTATALEALSLLEPQSPLIPKSINYILQARRGDWWVSTADTSAIISAALTLPKPSASNQQVKILLNGKSLAKPIVTASGITLDLEPSLTFGENTLSIEGDLSYGVRLEYIREPTRLTDQSDGIQVKRTYERLEKRWSEEEQAWEYIQTPLVQNGVAQAIKIGDLIMVNIEVSPESGLMRHVQIIEPVPAGFQAIPMDNLNLYGIKNPKTQFGVFADWNNWYAARDIYANRVEMFAQSLEPNNFFGVVLRAQTAGTYTHLPSSAELMYDPEIRGRSSAATLTVRE